MIERKTSLQIWKDLDMLSDKAALYKYKTDKTGYVDRFWLSEESVKKVIDELTLTGYRGNPEGYINAELLKERLKVICD